GKKLRFYQGESGLRETDLKAEELAIFRDILTHKRISLQKDIAALTRQIESRAEQTEFVGIPTGNAKQERLKLEEQRRVQRDEKQAELDRIESALDALRQTKTVPFVWDIAFVEIFEGEKKGFDIVIGNPPYVRYQKIAPPTLDPADFGGDTSDRWKEQKKAYKAKLQESVAAAYPKFFRYKPGRADFRKPDGKSDLYIYFYFHGLSLVNPCGSFCFITSNSWLDVGYGADLQEFLLRHSHVKFILDNEKKRSFAQADVNTIIALLAPPDDRTDAGLDKTARFVMFKVPFEEVLSAETFKALEAVTERQSTERWRISVLSQRALLEEGVAADEDEEETAKPHHRRGPLIKTARYIGNKWGGKYLRAPDVFFTVLEKGGPKLLKLHELAVIETYLNTGGADDFFFLELKEVHKQTAIIVNRLTKDEFEVERDFLRPLVESPTQLTHINIEDNDIRTYILAIPPEASIRGTLVEAYVRWGEQQGFCNASGRRRRDKWYVLSSQAYSGAVLIWPCRQNDKHYVCINPQRLVSHRFYRLHPKKEHNYKLLAALLNASLTAMLTEIHTVVGLGQGVLDISGVTLRQIPVVNPYSLSESQADKLLKAFAQLCRRSVRNLYEEIHQPDRRALDDVVFDVLGLTAGEREAVYEAVVNLVQARLEKARSV
ncbi:MAG: Eco57I restriction-modification methylase domain-containing protein, partial [Candidatus Caldarchaeum sp.]